MRRRAHWASASLEAVAVGPVLVQERAWFNDTYLQTLRLTGNIWGIIVLIAAVLMAMTSGLMSANRVVTRKSLT